jgi:hypothetical protein
MRAIEKAVIWANRLRGRMAPRRYAAGNVLLLLPHCLQRQGCPELVKEAIRNCKGCGRCKVKELKELAERMGVRARVASGGREALECARSPGVRAILAVACSKELAEGIRGAFPKRVVGILNSWPHGACKNTDVDVGQVEAALREIVLR